MIKRQQRLAGFIATAVLLASHTAAADPAEVFYISMRGLQTEAVPSYVEVSATATAQRSVAISTCNGQSHYAAPADASAIAAARVAGEVVHLHKGRAGDPPGTSRIICMIDAAGS